MENLNKVEIVQKINDLELHQVDFDGEVIDVIKYSDIMKLLGVNLNNEQEINDDNKYIIFTDGGSRMSKGIGSFAYVTLLGEAHDENVLKESSRVFYNVTNNQMELMGFISAFMDLIVDGDSFNFDVNNHIVVVSDSQYLTKGVNEYLPNWMKNGYKTSARKTIKNKDLWLIIEQILALGEMYNITFEFVWTRGHQNEDTYATKYNNICDENCNIIMDDLLGGSPDIPQPTDFIAHVDGVEGTLFYTKKEMNAL